MKLNKGPRRRSREIALQILYELETTGDSPDEAIRRFYDLKTDDDVPEVDAPLAVRPFAEQIVYGVAHNKPGIDDLIVSSSENWRLERMSLVDRNILRIAVYEMLFCADIPPKVSINEAIDLGKNFGTADSGAFINGILDNILPRIEKQGPEGPTSSAK